VHQFIRFILLLSLAASTVSPLLADTQWPREIETQRGLVVMYQPQPDNFTDNVLEGRAAVSVTLTGASEPVYGAVWFKARLETDW